MYLNYCYRDWYDYLYTLGYLITTYVSFTIIGSSVHSLTSLCSVIVSDRIIDSLDQISLSYSNTLLSLQLIYNIIFILIVIIVINRY